MRLDQQGDVWVLDLGEGDHRFGPDALDEVSGHLDVVEAASAPAALVTHAAGKIWHNGLDLDWLRAHPGEGDAYVQRVQALLARFLGLPVPTVAAVTGHAFAAGAMWALTHDRTIMRSDRGWWCLPEVDLGMAFPSGMNALVAARLPNRSAHEAMLTARRYTAAEALDAGIVDGVAPEAEVVPVALEVAAGLASTAGPTLAAIRRRLYRKVIRALNGEET